MSRDDPTRALTTLHLLRTRIRDAREAELDAARTARAATDEELAAANARVARMVEAVAQARLAYTALSRRPVATMGAQARVLDASAAAHAEALTAVDRCRTARSVAAGREEDARAALSHAVADTKVVAGRIAEGNRRREREELARAEAEWEDVVAVRNRPA